MSIILAEDRSGTLLPERSFAGPVVTIGRDSDSCDIVFDKAEFPMVSRKHAELRLENGEWFLNDLGSSYGTFLNSRRLDRPAPVPAGSAIQIGTDGPVLKVVWFDVAAPAASGRPAVQTPVPAVAAATPFAQPVRAQPAAVTPPFPKAGLQFQSAPSRPPFQITKPSVWLGRETTCDIVFDESSTTVSRRHAEISFANGSFKISDNNSFNGTFVNGTRITGAVHLNNADTIQLGMGGPVVAFVTEGGGAKGAAPGIVPADLGLSEPVIRSAVSETPEHRTVVARLDLANFKQAASGAGDSQLLARFTFPDNGQLTVGRDDSNDIRLDGFQISKRHARIVRRGSDLVLEDLGSTNGVYVNGRRESRTGITPDDSVQIGPFVLRAEPAGSIAVFDYRSKARLDAVGLSRQVRARGETINLLDDVSFSVPANEFVGVIGPSGAGKSSLIKALNGLVPASRGSVLINNANLYRNYESLKQSVGYVPQEDIIHDELTVYRTLYYTAKLRLSRDLSSKEIARMVEEVLDVTGLADRRDVQVRQLSGGQRKRVSIAAELVTKPSVLLLDEPTSGLDPVSEGKVMDLFRQIADSGRTVVMTTHAMETIALFDKVVILARGKLVYYGGPAEALNFFGVASFKELFEKLEGTADAGSSNAANRHVLETRAAEEWKQKFRATPQYRELVEQPLSGVKAGDHKVARKYGRLGLFGSLRQLALLSSRYLEVLFRDKLNVFVLFAQPVVIALLTFLVIDNRQPRDFVYFVLALVAIWFGTSIAAREIVRETRVYRRERMFNLGLIPYLGSKLLVLGIIAGIQCLLLFVPLKVFDLAGLMSMPGELLGIPQLWAMLLTAAVGIGIGLLVSSAVRTPELAATLVPLILIPQILFSGIVGVPHGANRVAGLTMPSAWSFDTMKRFSTLDTLEPEGADPRGKTKGKGLYDHIESENQKALDKAKSDLEELKGQGGDRFLGPEAPLPESLAMPEIRKIPDDLSGYVTFLHPWMNDVLNQVVLMLMFLSTVVMTLIVLRLKDTV